MPAEQVTGPWAEHGEGAIWWPEAGGLTWVDMLAGDVLRMGADGEVERWHVGAVAAAVRPRSSGSSGAVVATERELCLADEFGGSLIGLGAVFADPGLRFNEGGCDPDGRFLCGSMVTAGEGGRGSLYRLSADLEVDEVLSGITISNGLAWTADGRTAYYVDSSTGRVDAFGYDCERGLHDRRTLVDVPPEHGMPDGLTVDTEGGVWVAMFGGAAVRRYDAAGVLTAVVELPVSRVTSCTFGGDAGTLLYITTSRYGDPDPAESAGAVYVAEVGVAGLAVARFAG